MQITLQYLRIDHADLFTSICKNDHEGLFSIFGIWRKTMKALYKYLRRDHAELFTSIWEKDHSVFCFWGGIMQVSCQVWEERLSWSLHKHLRKWPCRPLLSISYLKQDHPSFFNVSKKRSRWSLHKYLRKWSSSSFRKFHLAELKGRVSKLSKAIIGPASKMWKENIIFNNFGEEGKVWRKVYNTAHTHSIVAV